ncbi:MAG: porin [Phycisphaerales bacterium]
MLTRNTGAAASLVAALAGYATAHSTPWTTQHADQTRAIVAEMLADAATRSSLLADSGSAGHDGKFFLASTDGNFRLNVSGQAQFRYTASFLTDDPVVNVDDFDSGFESPRTKLRFDGHIFEPSLFYAVQMNFDTNGGAARLEDAYMGYKWDNGWALIWGQLKMPVLWEDVVSIKNSLAADYSVLNAVINPGRSQGIWAHYSNDDWRMWAGFSDGIATANTGFTSPAEPDWGLTTRWEWKIAGHWSQFDQFTSPRGSEFAVKLGAATHWQNGPDVVGAPAALVGAYNADIMIKGDGWNLFAYAVGLHIDPDAAGAPSTDDFGALVQGGIYVTDDTELFARYDVVIPDNDRAADKAFNTVTFGGNYYLHGQAAKLTLDAMWFLDDTVDNALVSGIVGAPGLTGTALGLRPSTDGNQVALRLQFQLLF